MKILELDTHPYADAFPLLQGEAWDDFLADVKAHDLQDKKIHTYQGKILDGRNRGRAAELLDLKVTFVPYGGDDPFGFVLSRNFHRRQLNASQRAMVALKLASLKPGRPRKDRTNAELTTGEAATLANVSERQIGEAKFVRDHGIPELAAAVERGDINVTAAKKLAELDQGEQLGALQRSLEPETRKARGAAAERELKTRRPANGERQRDPGEQLFRTLQRALSELGASVKLKPNKPSDALQLDIAYDEHRYTLSLEDVTSAESAA